MAQWRVEVHLRAIDLDCGGGSSYQVNGKTTPFEQLDKELASENNDAYRALPAKVSKMVLRDYYAAMKSFFELLALKRAGGCKRS